MYFKDHRLAVEKLTHLVQGSMGCPEHNKPKVVKVVAYFANGRTATLDGFGKCTWTDNAEIGGSRNEDSTNSFVETKEGCKNGSV